MEFEMKKKYGAKISKARDLLDTCLKLEPGQKIFYACQDKDEAERMRVCFATTRREMSRSVPDIMELVAITKGSHNGVLGIILTKHNPVDDKIVVIDTSGEERQMVAVREPREEIAERLVDMIQSGISFEAMKENLNGYFPETLFPSRVEILQAIKWAEQKGYTKEYLDSLTDEK